jgi:hypothetical protein
MLVLLRAGVKREGRGLREKNAISVMPLRPAWCDALPEKEFARGSKKRWIGA